MAFSFRQIQYFVAAAENGAVSRAAHALSISQSAMAEAIRELEADLGFSLFERRAQGVELTLKGNQFLRHARKILADVAEARRAVSGGDETVAAGQLAVGVTPLVAGYVLAEILARYRRAFPAVTLDIVEDSRGYLEHLLVNGELDVGVIVAGSEREGSALKVESVDTSRYRVWLPTGHPLAETERISVRDLAVDPLVLLNVERSPRRRRKPAGWRGSGRKSPFARSRSRRREAWSRPAPASLSCRTSPTGPGPSKATGSRRGSSSNRFRRSRLRSPGGAGRRCRGPASSSSRWRAPFAARGHGRERFFRYLLSPE